MIHQSRKKKIMKAVLIEDENGQIVAYTRRGTFRDIDHAVQVLRDIDKINEYECMKLTRNNEDDKK